MLLVMNDNRRVPEMKRTEGVLLQTWGQILEDIGVFQSGVGLLLSAGDVFTEQLWEGETHEGNTTGEASVGDRCK